MSESPNLIPRPIQSITAHPMSRLETLNVAGRTVVFDARLAERKNELREALASDELKRLLSKTDKRAVAVLG